MDFSEIGKAIRAARKAKSLSQEQAGSPLRMSRATISGIENGTVSEVGIRKVMALCDQLNLELVVRPREQKLLSWDEQLAENERLKLATLNATRTSAQQD